MSSGVRGFPSWPGASAPIRGLIHWCETTDSSLTIFPCNARRVHTLGSSAFRLSTTTVSMSLAGSRFSSDSALGPLYESGAQIILNSDGLRLQQLAVGQ